MTKKVSIAVMVGILVLILVMLSALGFSHGR